MDANPFASQPRTFASGLPEQRQVSTRVTGKTGNSFLKLFFYQFFPFYTCNQSATCINWLEFDAYLSKYLAIIRQDLPVLVEERRQRVLDFVSERGFVSLGDLSQSLDASESTIRRDLDYWDERGAIKRTHGGAVFVADSGLPALEERSSRELVEKRLIAKVAADRIKDGEAILLDGGTTTLEVARLLVGRPLQIVTNSLPIANLFANSRETDLVILGGFVYPKTGVALGPLTVKMMEGINVRQTLLSVGGITAKGLFNSNLLLVETELAMMRCADEVVVVADHTKVGRQALAFLCELPAVDTLIVDDALSAEQRALLNQNDVRVLLSKPDGTSESL